MVEEWKEIEGTGGKYQVSNMGKVRDMDYKNSGNNIIKECSLLNTGRYFQVRIFYKKELVHRLVAKAFIDNPSNKPHINHLDCDGFNNNVSNLEWCTRSENMVHAYENDLMPDNHGENNGQSKLKEFEVLEIRELYKTGKYTQKNLGNMFDISQTQIYRIVNNKRW